MQILKCVVTVCLAVCALSLYAGDNDAQTKAREALEKKLNELQGQPQTPAPAAAPKSTPKPAPAKAPAPAPAPAPAKAPVIAQPEAQAPIAPAAADPESIAKARKALEQKMNELGAQPAPTVAPAAPAPVASQPAPVKQKAQPPVAPAPAAAPVAPAVQAAAPAVVQTPAAPGFSPVPAADPEAIAKAREALRQKMQSLEGQPPTAPTTAAAPQPPVAPPVAVTPVEPPTTPGVNTLPEADPAAINKARESVRTAMGTLPPDTAASPAKKSGLNFPPLQGPPLGISQDKEQKLRSLLQQYKMDLISPEQYQAARAKILAEP